MEDDDALKIGQLVAVSEYGNDQLHSEMSEYLDIPVLSAGSEESILALKVGDVIAGLTFEEQQNDPHLETAKILAPDLKIEVIDHFLSEAGLTTNIPTILKLAVLAKLYVHEKVEKTVRKGGGRPKAQITKEEAFASYICAHRLGCFPNAKLPLDVDIRELFDEYRHRAKQQYVPTRGPEGMENFFSNVNKIIDNLDQQTENETSEEPNADDLLVKVFQLANSLRTLKAD